MIVLLFTFGFILLITILFELITGQIYWWGWRVWFTREQFPTLYWIFMAIKVVAVPIWIYYLIQAIWLKHP